MLTHLSVRHFATVDQLELEPENGLTVISGETGAGKSVIIDALGLTLGDRADSSIVRHGHDRAEVLATFDLSDNPAARQWLADRELDDDNQCLLR
ncbi:MAG: AAA family ATPase, partial [Alcanivorax sp.]